MKRYPGNTSIIGTLTLFVGIGGSAQETLAGAGICTYCTACPDGMTIQQYAERFVAYSKAMKAVDPTIKIMGPVNAGYFAANDWFPPLIAELEKEGMELDMLFMPGEC